MRATLYEALLPQLKAILDDGGSLPIRMVVVGANDAMVFSRFDRETDDLTETILAEYPEPDELVLPLNILLVDGAGKARGITLMHFNA